MKRFFSLDFIIMFLVYCVFQPLVFFLCMGVFLSAIYSSIWG